MLLEKPYHMSFFELGKGGRKKKRRDELGRLQSTPSDDRVRQGYLGVWTLEKSLEKAGQ
jgi:hypothetical protein